MKTKLLLLALTSLVLLTGTGYAQPANSHDDVARVLQSPAMKQYERLNLELPIRFFWNGEDMAAALFLRHTDFRSALGISDEHYQEIQDNLRTIMDNNMQDVRETPEFQEMFAVSAAIMESVYARQQEPDMELINRLPELRARVAPLFRQVQIDINEKVYGTELMQKMQEAQLAAMGEISSFSPSMFGALNLTDAQRQEMKRIKEELEPEFERNLEIYVEGMMALRSVEVAVSEPFSGEDFAAADDNQRREMAEKAMAARARALRENPESRRIMEEIQSSSREFATLFKTRMFDVLTDEQWQRLQDLIDNPPPHARILIAKLREQRGETEENKSDVWVPGPHSWRPGNPIPESYRQQRGTFPRPQ